LSFSGAFAERKGHGAKEKKQKTSASGYAMRFALCPRLKKSGKLH
jgi:hypothetical protein